MAGPNASVMTTAAPTDMAVTTYLESNGAGIPIRPDFDILYCIVDSKLSQRNEFCLPPLWANSGESQLRIEWSPNLGELTNRAKLSCLRTAYIHLTITHAGQLRGGVGSNA